MSPSSISRSTPAPSASAPATRLTVNDEVDGSTRDTTNATVGGKQLARPAPHAAPRQPRTLDRRLPAAWPWEPAGPGNTPGGLRRPPPGTSPPGAGAGLL